VKLEGTEIFTADQFWRLISGDSMALSATENHALIFIHGYKTKFEDAARRAAQLKVDLAHKGPAAFFSWPSLGYGAGYTGDEAAIDASEQAIRAFLIDFAERSGANAVHIIAHSMGNRGLLRAMDAIANAAATATQVRFGQVFLAAPDVDSQLFSQLATAYGQLTTRTTLYVTNNDRAIGISRGVHGYHRVGLTPPVSVVSGVDTIDASHVNLGFWGHSYAAEMRPVLGDIHALLSADTPPDRRFGLRKAAGSSSHWEFTR
jgi:esterase/lipase superfamily enzyme